MRTLGVFLSLYALLGIINQSYIVNIIVLVIGLVLITTHQALTINTINKKISDYYWLFGLKLNTYSQSYHHLESIVLTQTNFIQGYGFIPRMHARGKLYKGYLKLQGQDSFYLGQHKNEKTLHKKLTLYANKLGLSITNMVTAD